MTHLRVSNEDKKKKIAGEEVREGRIGREGREGEA